MERLYTCCAGLDVHKQTVVVCLLHHDGAAERKEIRTFGTTRGGTPRHDRLALPMT